MTEARQNETESGYNGRVSLEITTSTAGLAALSPVGDFSCRAVPKYSGSRYRGARPAWGPYRAARTSRHGHQRRRASVGSTVFRHVERCLSSAEACYPLRATAFDKPNVQVALIF